MRGPRSSSHSSSQTAPVIHSPQAIGQLVWCPVDPSLGIGVVTALQGRRIKVRFVRLEQERFYARATSREECTLLRYKIEPGELVQHHDGRQVKVASIVVGFEEPREMAIYEIDDDERIAECDLLPDLRDVGPKERLASLNLAHPAVVAARMQGLKLRKLGVGNGMEAVLGTRAMWLPHQIDVAAQALKQSTVRRLLADEVGLGKTVEAAFIYAGLRSQGRADRVLILTPEALTIQWLGEIFRKAHELLVLLDDERIADAYRDFPRLSPFEAHQRMVCSLEQICDDDKLFGQAQNCQWDLVIVDEAHHLRWQPNGQSNKPYKLLEGLAKRSTHLLLLTATPMALDPVEYHALLRLLAPQRFDDPKSFSHLRDRVTLLRDLSRVLAKSVAEKTPLEDTSSSQLTELLADDDEDSKQLQKFCKLSPQSKVRGIAAESLLEALRERHGLADYVVRNRRGPVGGMPKRHAQVIPLEPTEAQEHLIDIGEGIMFDLVSSIEDEDERVLSLGRLLRALWATPRALLDIIAPLSPGLAAQLTPYVEEVLNSPVDNEGLPTGDARLRWLVRYLNRLGTGGKALVFLETSIAVRALRDALSPFLGKEIAVFHGELAARDQDRQVAWFRSATGPRLMISTEAGGEGRNFQFCNQVILYDMPWRPATVEQRIGRIDRVGQNSDVHVIVPHFKSGYEAAIVKIMQQAIGVLDSTVGGIDHALEYVAGSLGKLILNEEAKSSDWKELYRETSTLINTTRTRIENAVDPILDHASFSAERVNNDILNRIPEHLEAQLENFIQGYADHNKLELRPSGPKVIAVEGAPSASGSENSDGYTATFSRTHALDHEEVEFLSFGHPLIKHALDWAEEAHDASAALAICRGYDRDGAIFIWRFGLGLPADSQHAAAYFQSAELVLALDESGTRQPEFEGLLDDPSANLERMDPAPLRQAVGRWRHLVEHNFESAQRFAEEALNDAKEQAILRFDSAMQKQERFLQRQLKRAQQQLSADALQEWEKDFMPNFMAFKKERIRLKKGISYAHPTLNTAVAVRLVKVKSVSA